MKKWTTQFKAIDPKTGFLETWVGEHVEAPTMALAQEWCNKNRGHLVVTGELIAEIPLKNGSPDFKNTINYDLPNLN